MIDCIIPLVRSWLPIWHEYVFYIFVLSLIPFSIRVVHLFFRR